MRPTLPADTGKPRVRPVVVRCDTIAVTDRFLSGLPLFYCLVYYLIFTPVLSIVLYGYTVIYAKYKRVVVPHGVRRRTGASVLSVCAAETVYEKKRKIFTIVNK